MRTLWRRYELTAWVAPGFTLTMIAFLTMAYSLGQPSWLQLASSYGSVLFMGVVLRGVFLTHYRDSATVYAQLHALNQLNTRFARGEISTEEWTKGAEEALGRRPR